MENQRIRLSKQMLKNALYRLLQHQSLESIKIYELCKEAQINRTTFYNYFGSQYDLFNEMQTDFFEELNKHVLDADKTDSGLYNVLKLLLEKREQFIILMNSSSDSDFSDKLFRIPSTEQELHALIPTNHSPKETEYIYTFFCHGGYAIIRQWLNEDEPENPKIISQLLHKLVSTLLTPVT